MKAKPIELLAPARDLQVGKCAIDAGADAVYIGPAQFGARAAAGNSDADIAELCRYAHLYGCRVWATLNTLLFDGEVEAAVQQAWQLYDAGVDGLLIQDMGMLECELPPIRLHASTQCDCSSSDKLRWLQQVGFSRAVLARELSCEQIRALNDSWSDRHIELEAFVHGALCVSYSGQCYMSEAVSQRSANRGRCAQLCRQQYDLLDADKRVIRSACYPLSLCDLDRSSLLRELLEAGVSSLKIEGRLKDAGYVRNIVGYYRLLLDELFEQSDGKYRRASYGRVSLGFEPNPEKTFHRGATALQIPTPGDNTDNHLPLHLANMSTPKSTGEQIGTVAEVRSKDVIDIATSVELSAGDGIVIGSQGAYVNRVEQLSDGVVRVKTSSPLIEHSAVTKHLAIYRNYDKLFLTRLSAAKTQRLLPVSITLTDTDSGFLLTAAAIGQGEDVRVEQHFEYEKTEASNPEAAIAAIRLALAKLGGTGMEAVNVNVRLSKAWFIPASQINGWRREVCARLSQQLSSRRTLCKHIISHPTLPTSIPTDYRLNVSNSYARRFYEQCGVADAADAFELAPEPQAALMTCRYCLLRELGQCRKLQTTQAANDKSLQPAYLRTAGKLFRLSFDCKNCLMHIYKLFDAHL